MRNDRSGSPVSSSVSIKSDCSIGVPPNLSEETPTATKSDRSGSPVSSSVSIKSDCSIGVPPNLSEETPTATKSDRSGSPVSSSVSMKSDCSLGVPPNLSEETPTATKRDRSGSVSSSVSVKSDCSRGKGANVNEKTPTATKRDRSGSVSSSVSVKSDCSRGKGANVNEKTPTATKSNQGQKNLINIGAEITRWKTLKQQKKIKSDEELASFLLNRVQIKTSDAGIQSNRFRKHFRDNLLWIFQDLENKVIIFLKNELERFKKILKKENTQYFVKDFQEDRNNIKEAVLDITLYFLRDRKHDELADKLEDELVFIHHQKKLKSNLKKKYECVFEGIAKHGDSTLLNKIYTDLYITQGEGQQINTEHEVRQIEAASRRLETPEIQIECTHLFKQPGQDQYIRTVLTKGVAGIGKSVSAQKFVLDWAEGKENQDISFIFPLPFREMNLKEKVIQSLMDLISQFFPEIKGLNLTRNDKFKVLFITTRPAAAVKIPPECIDRVTEVRGFNDEQKEEYFRKRFTDENMADTIIDHVKKSKSLFIMCHIPVFCWISATVLQNILEKKRNDQSDDTTSEYTPRTLTQMYTHFFRFQIQQSRRKYEGKYSPDISWDKESILSLGKLAFQNLERNNLIFYDSDLEACGIDITKASVYSGMCTQIFKQETGIITGTMYCFVHMSIQEFTAALYAHLFLDINKKNAFVQEHKENSNDTMIGLLKTAVDKALESENGHLDLFLRFLLGLSLESNRPLLRGLLTQEESNEQSNKEIVEYIKQKFNDNSSAERSINLFYCLNELNDQSLVKEIQKHLREGSLSSADLSPAQWSALVFVLLTSEEELEEFELQKFKKSDECLIRLSPVVKTAKKALLNDCNLTDKGCSALANVLGSDSRLKELNMSNNNLKDSGVKLICDGLMNTKCELEILRLSDCSIGEEGYVALCSAVRSNPSHLIELDLSGNDPGESGVKLIYHLIQDQNCALKKVRLLQTSAAAEGFKYLSETLVINPLLQRELNLNDHKLNNTRVKQICDLLKDKHCRLNTLRLSGCGLTEESCSALASVLRSKSGLKELDMSNNNLQDSGVKTLHNGLENTNCQLHKLRLSDCSIGEEGYVALYSAVRSNPSHLIELDLSGNDPGESGVKLIYELIQDPKCALKTVRFLQSRSAEEARQYLNKVVGKEILLQRDLNLNDHKLNNTRVKQICDLLKDKHCRLNTLMLGQCGLKDEGVSALTLALHSNPSHLRQLDLSGNKLSDTDVESLCFLLGNPQFKLETLGLCGCSITEKQCVKLISALCTNPSHLRELNLSDNTLKDSGVKHLCHLLKHSDCKLEKLKLCKCSIKYARCDELISALCSNPSHLKELNLSENKIKDTGLNLLSNLLNNSDCKLNKLSLNKCKITDVAPLLKTLADTTTLRFLDLSNNHINDSSLNQLREVLKRSNCELRLESKGWLPWNLKMPGLWGEQSSSDEEKEDTSSQKSFTPKDEAEADQSTDGSSVDQNMETPV
nr:NACHT, LRR and PYD domains-containing protein 3-like [Misgurnus anguillicaudatus]